MTPSTHVRLGIDFGTTHTVAVLETPDGRIQPLLFDSSPLLSSAVYAEPNGQLLTGRDGSRSAGLDPTRYEPNPKRRIDDTVVLLGSDEISVARVIGAVLDRVAGEAVRAVGGRPTQTVLTYPATWGPRRKDILAEAAGLAGLAPVTMVPEPVAAAAHFTGVLGRSVPPGAALAIYDFGGGTFDASLVRRRPDGAWELVAFEGLTDVGGLDLDATLVELIGRTVAPRDPQLWRRLLNPADPTDRRAARTFWDDVRAAKEQLSRTSSAALHLPLFDIDTHLTREEFEAAARPLLGRTVEVLAGLIAHSRLGPGQLAGLYLVGGSSRIPLITTMLHQRVGVAPVLIDQPELLVAHGSLRAIAPPHPAAAPGWAQQTGPVPVPGLLPPPGMPASGPGFAAPGAAPGFAAPAVPVSGLPGGAPAPAPVSASPGGSVSGPPSDGWSTPPGGIGSPVGMGQPPPPLPGPPGAPPTPLWPQQAMVAAPHPPGARPMRRRSGTTLAVVGAITLVVIVGIAYGAVAARNAYNNARNTAADQRPAGARQATGNPAGGAVGGTATRSAAAGPGRAQEFDINQTVWYRGKKFTFGVAKYDPATKRDNLQIDVTIANLSTKSDSPGSGGVYFAINGQSLEGQLMDVPSQPGGATVKGRYVFDVDKPITDLKAGELTVGPATYVQAVINLADPTKTITLEPKVVLDKSTTVTVKTLTFTVTRCEFRADIQLSHTQAPKDSRVVTCVFDVKYNGTGIYDHGVWDNNLRLKLPDGTIVAPKEYTSQLLDPQEAANNVPVSFVIRWPAPGDYAFHVHDAGRLGGDPPGPGNAAEVPMTLG